MMTLTVGRSCARGTTENVVIRSRVTARGGTRAPTSRSAGMQSRGRMGPLSKVIAASKANHRRAAVLAPASCSQPQPQCEPRWRERHTEAPSQTPRLSVESARRAFGAGACYGHGGSASARSSGRSDSSVSHAPKSWRGRNPKRSSRRSTAKISVTGLSDWTPRLRRSSAAPGQ